MRPSGESRYIACHDCDTLFEAPTMQEGERIVCPVCSASLFTFQPNALHRASAYVVAAAVLFFVANIFPFLTLKKDLRMNQMLLYESVSGLVDQGYAYLAVAVAVFTLVAPTLLIVSLLYLLLPLLPGSVVFPVPSGFADSCRPRGAGRCSTFIFSACWSACSNWASWPR